MSTFWDRETPNYIGYTYFFWVETNRPQCLGLLGCSSPTVVGWSCLLRVKMMCNASVWVCIIMSNGAMVSRRKRGSHRCLGSSCLLQKHKSSGWLNQCGSAAVGTVCVQGPAAGVQSKNAVVQRRVYSESEHYTMITHRSLNEHLEWQSLEWWMWQQQVWNLSTEDRLEWIVV